MLKIVHSLFVVYIAFLTVREKKLCMAIGFTIVEGKCRMYYNYYSNVFYENTF